MIRRGSYIAAVSVLLGLGIVTYVGSRAYVHATSLSRTAQLASHTHLVIETLDELLLSLDDAVAFRRGFALSGDDAQLPKYRAAVERFQHLRPQLSQLTADNQLQQKRLAELQPLLTERLAQLESNLQPRNGLGLPAGREAEITAEGNRQSDHIQQLVNELATEEKQLLAAREAEEQVASEELKRTLLLGFGASLAVLVLAFFLLRRETARRALTEKALADREGRIATTLNSIADAIISADEAGAVVQMNPQAEQLTGWAVAQARGRPVHDVFRVIDEQTHTPVPNLVSQVLSTRRSIRTTNHTLLVAKDASLRPIAHNAAPILDAENRLQGAVIVFRDVTASRLSEGRFKRLLEAAPDAILITDRAGRITIANRQATTLFGFPKDELFGKPIEMLIPERFRIQHEKHRSAYGAAPAVRPMGAGLSLSGRRKDGSEFPVEVSLSPLQGDDGMLVIAAVRDISKRHELESFRDEYLEFISHDLKNPLSIISLQARLLARQLNERKLPEEAHAVAIIAQSTAFIDELVRDLLEMAYVESEKVKLHLEPTPMAALLEAVLDRTISTIDRQRVRLEVQGPVTALVEPRRIERVVVNFIQNALKYSRAGSPIIVKLDARDETASVSVTNQGPGLSPDESEFVFEKYRRSPGARGKEGLGLGLYISRKIVEHHGGRIGVENTAEGATFFFEVPLARGQTASALSPPTPAPKTAAHLGGLKVLLVDDEPNAVSALKTLLTDEGIEVWGATSAEEALAVAEAKRPDVAVLDVQLPGMDGLALLQRLRERHPGLPAVIMSGYMAHHAGIAKARTSLGAAYIGKPVDPDELVRTLARIVPTHLPRPQG
jgi:PAS domain S-box-containing protein